MQIYSKYSINAYCYPIVTTFTPQCHIISATNPHTANFKLRAARSIGPVRLARLVRHVRTVRLARQITNCSPRPAKFNIQNYKFKIIKKGAEADASTPSLIGGGYLLSHFRSTIGVAGFNFSVRNGKRWIPRAIATLVRPTGKITLRSPRLALGFPAVIRLEKESESVHAALNS